jgi:hypothetical protein
VNKVLRAGVPLWVAALLLMWAPAVSTHNPITTTVLFNREIAAILNQKCSQCHVAEGMAMPLQTYNEVRPWAVAIKEEILARQMPPWSAERGHGAFANDVSLTPREQEFLISWIDGGVPEGTGEPPPHIDHSAHWMLGTPDAILTATKDVKGPAPEPGFTRFIVNPAVRRDTWIRAFDFKPADKRAIRAAFLSVAGTGEYLGGWTPWYTSTELPSGSAFRLPAGSAIAIDVLPGASTAPAGDPPRLGLYFASGAPQRVTNLVLAGDQPPAGGRLRTELPLTADETLVGMRVDMSPGAKTLEIKAMRPDGSFESLLWIRDFRPEWQTPYVFKSPVPLPRGTVLVANASFDAKSSVPPRLRVVVNAFSEQKPRVSARR